MKKWMRAAILTLCGTLSLAMTSCTEEDNPSNPVENPDQSKYTLEQLQTIAHGAWLDEMQLTATDNVRLYNIDDNGQCDIYDFANNDEEEEDENDNATTYTGTWSVTRDLSKLHFIDQLNISGFELIGGLMIQVKMKIDENAEPHWVINHVAGRYGIPEMAMRYIVNATMSNEHIGHVLLNRKYAKTGIMVVDYVGITVIEGTGTWVKERKTVETFETGKRLKRLKRLSVFLSFCEAQRCERGKYILILLYIIYKVRVV